MYGRRCDGARWRHECQNFYAWLVGAFFFHTLGELCLSPIGLSLVTKLAPLLLASLMMGAWFGCTAIANYVAGYVGSHVGELGAMAIFSGIAVTAIVSGVILLLFSPIHLSAGCTAQNLRLAMQSKLKSSRAWRYSHY